MSRWTRLAQAAERILGLSRAGVRAVALSHTAIAEYVRQGDGSNTALSEDERRVLLAVLTGGDLDAALTPLSTTDYDTAWRNQVRQYAATYNAGDVQVDVTGGSITAEGNGVEAVYAVQHDDNGAIEVTVAAGATVTGGKSGVFVVDAGATGLMLENRYAPDFDAGMNADAMVALEGYRNQRVTVRGTVTGGTGAAVHLSGGGALIVERDGMVLAGSSGRAVHVNDPGPAHVYVDGTVRGGAGARAAVDLTGGGSVTVGPAGRVLANGADHAIRGGGGMVVVTLAVAGMYREHADRAVAARVEGGYEDVDTFRFLIYDARNRPTGYSHENVPPQADGTPDTSRLTPRPTDPGPDPGPDPGLSCTPATGRCGLHQALPSVLLSMNGLPSYAERMSAARDANGGWARVEVARGEWQAKEAAATTGKLAYDHRRTVGRAGVDFVAGGQGRAGVSMHMLEGKAEMAGMGEVELDGMGLGASGTWLEDDLYVDAQAAVTWYDVDPEPDGELKKDVSGRGYALGLEMGKRMPVGGVLVTPRAGVAWSKVTLDDFHDMEMAGGRMLVSVEKARSTKGRLGVMVEREVEMGEASGHVFGSVDVEREFSDETEVDVSGMKRKTKVRPTAVRLGVGGVFGVGEDTSLRATAGYGTSGSGTKEYGVGVVLSVRF